MRRVLLLAGLMCLAASVANAQDEMKVDPKHSKVEVDNDQVRVLRTVIGPKESTPMHDHPPSVLVFLTDSNYRTIYPDGRTVERMDAAGSVIFRPPVKHVIENLSDKNFELIQVELKPKPTASAIPASDDALAAKRASSQ